MAFFQGQGRTADVERQKGHGWLLCDEAFIVLAFEHLDNML
jgi:hypothetical protein